MAFDAGLFTFRDIYLNKNLKANSIFVLITNPKNVIAKTRHEQWPRIKHSSHIRFLVFSRYPIQSTRVYLNDKFIGEGAHTKNSSLFTLEWDPSLVSNGFNEIRVIAQVSC